jgi:hypothetical protein
LEPESFMEQISGEWLEASMKHVSSHNAFNILFTLGFFASFAAVMIRFG